MVIVGRGERSARRRAKRRPEGPAPTIMMEESWELAMVARWAARMGMYVKHYVA